MRLINPKKQNDIKLIVTDLNNTLLGKDKLLSDKTVQMFEILQKNNIVFVIATSHSENVAMSLLKKIAPDFLILCDGAMVKYGTQTIHMAAIPGKTANEIISILMHSDKLIDLTVDSEKFFFSMRQSTNKEKKCGYSNTIMTDFTEPINVDNILKITPRLTDAEITQEILKKYHDIYLVEFKSEKGYQFKSNIATKHNALLSICNKFKISLNEVMAFGDDYTDVEMLRLVSSNGGCAIAVENASNDCRNVADFLCGNCETDGIFYWIKQYIQ